MKFPSLTVCGRIERCLLFVYRTPVEVVGGLLPEPLRAVTHGGFAFWNVVVCQLRYMRPWPMPMPFGWAYQHVAYRLHAEVDLRSGGKLEGLFFARSDCDSPLVATTGNRLTDFRFHRAEIDIDESTTLTTGEVRSPEAAAHFEIDRNTAPRLAAGSPFVSLDEAAMALEYKPAALSPRSGNRVEITRVRRDEAAWRWRLVKVIAAEWEFFRGKNVQLELCYEVAPVDYEWQRATTEEARPCGS